jgi:hypothetical protein
MALGPCRECGREVSKSAGICPGCGIKGPVKQTSWGMIVLACLLGLGAIKVCSGAAGGHKESGSAAAAEAPVAPVELAQLAASTLREDYDANQIAADHKYKGRRFRVSGTVAAITSDFADDPQVWLVSDGLGGVDADGLSKTFAGTLKKGDTLRAACTVTGSMIGTPTIDCSGPQ